MEITTLCAVVVSLRVDPNRSQFFQYESVNMTCEDQGNSSDWRVKRSTSRYTNQDCASFTDRESNSTCSFDTIYEADSGLYWCESSDRRLSSSVSITVTAASVILDMSEQTVDEGEALTLHCRTASSFNQTYFYKDHLLIGNSSTGNFTIQPVSESSEGNYTCRASEEESLSRRLTVRVQHPERSPSVLAHVLLPVAGAFLLLMVLMLCLWRNHKGKVDRTVSYTDVTITQEEKAQTICDVGVVPTFYSGVKPETS